MIPKIIHLCWISGDPYPPLIERCISTWGRVLPDYQIVKWDHCKVSQLKSRWVAEAVAAKKYAFASDFIRLHALYYHGGIYLDADVEVLRPFDSLLDQPSFIGLESSLDIEAAVIGAAPGLDWIKACLDYYTDRRFFRGSEGYDMKPLPIIIREVLYSRYAFEIPTDNLPQHCLNSSLLACPPSYFSPKNRFTGRLGTLDSTYCIHHLDGSWVDRSFNARAKRLAHYMLARLLTPRLHRSAVEAYRKIRR